MSCYCQYYDLKSISLEYQNVSFTTEPQLLINYYLIQFVIHVYLMSITKNHTGRAQRRQINTPIKAATYIHPPSGTKAWPSDYRRRLRECSHTHTHSTPCGVCTCDCVTFYHRMGCVLPRTAILV